MKISKVAGVLAMLVLVCGAALAQEEFSTEAEDGLSARVEEGVATRVEDVSSARAENVPSVKVKNGFSAKVDIDTNLVQFYHQDIKNDTFVANSLLPREDSVYFMRNPNYDDVDLDVSYLDPEERFFGKINFAFAASLDKFFTPGDIFGWVKVSPFFRGKLGKYTDRVVEKIGGDKDLGVLLFGVNNGDLTISTSDSLGLGSDIIGFLPAAIVPFERFGIPAGTLELRGFFAPNEYYLAKRVTNEWDQNSSTLPVEIPAYATYKFGGGLKYTFPAWVTIGASYRTAHTDPVTTSDIGNISHDFGVYAIVTVPMIEGLKAGLGYSGNIFYEDKDDDSAEMRKPLKSAVHVDVSYSGIIPGLTVGLFNNLSFHKLDKVDTFGYIKELDALNNVFGDEESFVLYNELSASYAITPTLVASLMARNYYATLTNRDGALGQDYAKNTFIVEALARYNITAKVQARAGVKFELNNYGTPINSAVLKNSNNAVSIPIGLTVAW